jgi:hypothetical protein
LPDVDTGEFEECLATEKRQVFQRERSDFVALVYEIISELGLEGCLDHVTVSGLTWDHALLCRRTEEPWPSRRVLLELYPDRYMDRELLTHEFGHEADRHNPDMLYTNEIEQRFEGDTGWALTCAANISLDARLGDRGLGRERRRTEFVGLLGRRHLALFDENWAHPPLDWPGIAALAEKLLQLQPETP